MLWLALYFPQLLIDGLSTPVGSSSAIAMVRSDKTPRLVEQCSASAVEAGISPGMPLNTAYALQPALQVLEFGEQQQQNVLDTLGQWAMQYSSSVSPEGLQALLLEIQGSLRLFAGLEKLTDKIDRDLQALGFRYYSGIAPTPAAALLLAHATSGRVVLETGQIEAAIADIGVEYLGFSDFVQNALYQSGIRRCEQLVALPVASLTRRFGTDTGARLYKLLGKLPEPRLSLVPREGFSQSLELPLETTNLEVLQFSLNRLLAALSGFLQSRELGVEELAINIDHHRRPSSQVLMRFSDPAASRKHLLRVCRERLERENLAAPAIAIGLHAIRLAPLIYRHHDLFDRHANLGSDINRLLDTLCARLGKHAVMTLATRDEHRPELASQNRLPETPVESGFWPLRPLWLLDEPRPAPPLKLLGNAERIESGWAEGEDIRRDYFIARDRQSGSFYWVYRTRHDAVDNEVFFIHGIFS